MSDIPFCNPASTLSLMKLYTLKQRAAADLKKVAAGRIHPRQTFLPRRSLSFFPIPDEFIMRTSCVKICRTENHAGRLPSPSSRVPSISPTTKREFEVWWRLRRPNGVSSRHLSVADRVDLTVAPLLERRSRSAERLDSLC